MLINLKLCKLGGMRMDLNKIENIIIKLQDWNYALIKKLSSFFIWLLVSSFVFVLVASGVMQLFDAIGFEKTLILVLLVVIMTNVKEQFKRA